MDKPTYEELEAENTRLKGRMAVHDEAGSATPNVRVWPRVGRGVLILLGCLSLLAVDLGLWANRNLINNEGYVAAVAPLAKDPAVQTAVVKATEQQIDANTDISTTVQNALPDKAAFLAGPITTGVNNAIHSFLAKAVDSPKFADAWTTVNDRAHSRIINYVSKYEGNGQITVADAYSSLSDRLAGTKLGSVVANKPLPPKLGNIQLIDASWLPIAHTAAVAVQWSVPVGILIAIIGFGAAIWWSPRRRKTLIVVALTLAFTLGLANIIVRLIQQVRENNIADPTYRAAAHSVSQAVLGPFIVQTRVWIVVRYVR